MEIGLYFHIPFCHKICNYCDFVKRVSNYEFMEKYIHKLIEEINLRKSLINKYTLKSIYIGGGTPSSLPNNLLDELLNSIAVNCFNEGIEYTIEANPEDIDDEFIKTITKYHINRVSIGIQSFNKNVQSIINRECNYSDIKSKMQKLRDFGLKNVNLDYMYGILPLSNEEIKKDLELILSLEPTHISTYSLILEEKTVLYHRYLKNQFKTVDPDMEANTYYYIQDFLNNHQYYQYELSNFSKTGYQSIHNFIYWSNERYLGLGLGSSSYIENYRFKNPTDFKDYLKLDLDNKDFYSEIEELSIEEELIYQVITNLRTVIGLDLKKFKEKFKVDFFDKFKVNDLLTNNLCINKNDRFFINPKYFYISNTIINKILE